MRMEREAGIAGPLVTGFGPAGFRVGEASFPALLLTVAMALPWSPPPLDAVSATDLAVLVEAAPEFVLLGTGATLNRPPTALTRALEAQGIGIEPMDSRAAARAWGILRSEGRRIAAALYPLN